MGATTIRNRCASRSTFSAKSFVKYRSFRKLFVSLIEKQQENAAADRMHEMFLRELKSYGQTDRLLFEKLMNAFYELKNSSPFDEILRDTLKFVKFFVEVCALRKESNVANLLRFVKSNDCIDSILSDLSEKIVKTRRPASRADARTILQILTELKGFARLRLGELEEFKNFFHRVTYSLSFSELISIFYIMFNSFDANNSFVRPTPPVNAATETLKEKQCSNNVIFIDGRSIVGSRENCLPFKKRKNFLCK